MRPLTLVLAAVIAVAGAYAVVFWRNASDVRQQMEDEQANQVPEALQQYDAQGGSPDRYTSEPLVEAHPVPQIRGGRVSEGVLEATPPVSGSAIDTEPNPSDLSEPVLDPETAQAPQVGSVPDQDAENKERNYAALEHTARRIGGDIQRQMMRGEILRRGRAVGAAFLQHMGYPVNEGGEHVTSDGSFVVDVRGPDLFVIAGVSEEFGNQLEISIIGPREVDLHLRRVR